MTKHNISPEPLMGLSYILQDNEISISWCETDTDKKLFLEFSDAPPGDNKIIGNVGSYIVPDAAYKLLLNSGLSGLYFKQYDSVVSGEDYDIVNDKFWLLLNSRQSLDTDFYDSTSETDIILARNLLIVSDTALDFMQENGIFEDLFLGSDLGEPYEFLSNRFTFSETILEFMEISLQRLIMERMHKRKMLNEKYKSLG